MNWWFLSWPLVVCLSYLLGAMFGADASVTTQAALEGWYQFVKNLSLIAPWAGVGTLVVLWSRWQEENRPYIVVWVEEESFSKNNTFYELVVHNAGNRSAFEIKLQAVEAELKRCFHIEVSSEYTNPIHECLLENNFIPVLIPGGYARNVFGANSTVAKQNVWQPSSIFTVILTYKNGQGRLFEETIKVYVRDNQSINGTLWTTPEEDRFLENGGVLRRKCLGTGPSIDSIRQHNQKEAEAHADFRHRAEELRTAQIQHWKQGQQ